MSKKEDKELAKMYDTVEKIENGESESIEVQNANDLFKFDIKRFKEIVSMSPEERQKKIKEFMSEDELKELDKVTEGIKVGESYNFLFEGKNNEYDDEYKDYIEDKYERIKEIEESFSQQKTNYISVKQEDVVWLIDKLRASDIEADRWKRSEASAVYYLKKYLPQLKALQDVIVDAVSIGEAQGENFLLEPWCSLRDAMDSFTKMNILESYDGADLGNDF
jgi:uncharacterized phage infection (PIP) family protein YhgE